MVATYAAVATLLTAAKSRAELIEDALCKRHKLKPPKRKVRAPA